MYHSDPIKYIFLESFWSGRVKYCIFDDDGPKYLGRGTKFSQWTANIWTIWTNQTYSTDGLFRAQYTFLVAGGEWADDDDDHGDYDYGDDVCTKFRGLGSGQAA